MQPTVPRAPDGQRRSPSSGIDGIVAHIKGLERERDRLLATIEKLRGVLSGN